MHGFIMIHNIYLTIAQIGYGYSSTVWLCHNIVTNKYVAIKIIKDVYFQQGLEEIQIYRDLHKLNIRFAVNVLDSFEWEYSTKTFVCLVFQLLTPIGLLLNRTIKYKYGFGINNTKYITAQIIHCLMDLRKNKLCHLDIKPSNILIDTKIPYKGIISFYKKTHLGQISNVCDKLRCAYNNNDVEGLEKYSQEINSHFLFHVSLNFKDFDLTDFVYDNQEVYVADFGEMVHESILSESVKCQTLYYRAPEVLLKYKRTRNSDKWSLGCTIYEILTGDLLFPDREGITCRHILQSIVEVVGPFPKKLIKKSPCSELFFTIHGNVKPRKKTVFRDICIDEDYAPMILLVYKLLEYNHKKRCNYEELLETLADC